MKAETAAALIIGNEILGAKVREANVYELAGTLRSLGIALRRVVVVPDELELIASEVKELAAQFDQVFTSGGIGPTHDDVTIAGVAAAFGVAVVREPEVATLIRQHYGASVTESHLLLANVPEGSTLLRAEGSAWPVTLCRNVWIMPGIPEVFRMKLQIVAEHLKGPVVFASRALYTKLDEPDLKELLDGVVSRHADVEIGSYPKWNDPRYQTKITFDGTNADAVERALNDLAAELPEGEPRWTE